MRRISYLLVNDRNSDNIAGFIVTDLLRDTDFSIEKTMLDVDSIALLLMPVGRMTIFNDICMQGVVTSVHVSVPYVGVIHTTAETYAKCRAALRAYFRPFVNWPLGVDLVPDLSSEGCGRMTFDQTTFTAGNTVCQIG